MRSPSPRSRQKLQRTRLALRKRLFASYVACICGDVFTFHFNLMGVDQGWQTSFRLHPRTVRTPFVSQPLPMLVQIYKTRGYGAAPLVESSVHQLKHNIKQMPMWRQKTAAAKRRCWSLSVLVRRRPPRCWRICERWKNRSQYCGDNKHGTKARKSSDCKEQQRHLACFNPCVGANGERGRENINTIFYCTFSSQTREQTQKKRQAKKKNEGQVRKRMGQEANVKTKKRRRRKLLTLIAHIFCIIYHLSVLYF